MYRCEKCDGVMTLFNVRGALHDQALRCFHCGTWRFVEATTDIAGNVNGVLEIIPPDGTPFPLRGARKVESRSRILFHIQLELKAAEAIR